jgi:outer membrane lipoprotein-sorting protein
LKLLLGVFLALTASAGGAPGKKPKSLVKSEIDQALAPLRQEDGVSVPLKKKSVNNLLMKEKNSKGTLHYWRGKLRVETESPDETLLVMDGKTIWVVNKLPEDMGGKTLVSKTNARSFKKSNTFFAALLEDGKLLKEFKVKDRKVIETLILLELVPKSPDDSEIQKLELSLQEPGQRLQKVTYWDDKENEVTFELGVVKSIDGDRKALFSYKPPKDAEVTEF